MKRYYFIDYNIYFQGGIVPPRKVELFNIKFDNETDTFTGFDIDGNLYRLNNSQLIIEEEYKEGE